MNIILLRDMVEDTVDAVIITETSTKEEVQIAIEKVKSDSDWQFEDIVNNLPEDCSIYTVWGSDIEHIWY